MKTTMMSAAAVALLSMGTASAQTDPAGSSTACAAAASQFVSADESAAVTAAFPPPVSGMTLTFDDEFDTYSLSNDNVADGTKWTDHLWFADPRPDLIGVSNGVLSLTADQNPATNHNGFAGQIASVNEHGQGFTQRFGYFEASIRVPSGQGTWPSFYLINNDRLTGNPNAPDPEIDVIEAQGARPAEYYTTLHLNAVGTPDKTNYPDFVVHAGVDISQGFHRYGMLWDPNSATIDWYYDGQRMLSSPKFSTTDSATDMLVLGSDIGDFGAGGNDPNASTPNAVVMQVDWVHVYQFSSQLTAMSTASAAGCP